MRLSRFGGALGALVVALANASFAVVPAHATVGPCDTGTLSGPVSGVYTCTYTSAATSTFTVPPTVSQISVDAVGGRGGYGWLHALNSSYSIGGYGAHATGTAAVTGGASLTVAVAGNGGNGGNSAAGSAGSQGGGAGGSASRGGGGGGGASSVFAGASALLVAAGGGGAGGSGTAGNGGAAGSPGQNGASYPCAGGGAGTTSGPGAGGSQAGCVGGGGASGTGNVGGDGGASSLYAGGGGGGGGYFGGGGGQGSDQGDAAGGGGGSSYSTDAGASITVDSTGTPSVKISWSLPAPTVAGIVKDSATSQPWSGTEVAGASAYASSSITQINSTVPTGSVTYSWYSGSGCSGSPTSSDTESIAGDGSVPDSAASGPLSAGDYSVGASYAGDSNYAANADCDNFSVLAQLGAPTVTTVAPADGRATVNWTPATPGASPITGYAVSVLAPDGSPATGVTGATTRSAAASATSFVFSGLSNGVSYAFSVRASDANGPGPSSQLSTTAVPRPRVSIGSAAVPEGARGTRNASFTVSLSAPSAAAVSVHYATADGTASSASDYSARSGTLTIPAGATSGAIAVPIIGDTTTESNETFTVNISSPVNAVIGLAKGTGTILNDDPSTGSRTVSIGDASIEEGRAGTRVIRLTVSLSNASSSVVTVGYATANGTALAGSDYVAKSGVVTIAAGSLATVVSITVNGDTAKESTETFTVKLSSPSGAVLGRSTGTATIINDD